MSWRGEGAGEGTGATVTLPKFDLYLLLFEEDRGLVTTVFTLNCQLHMPEQNPYTLIKLLNEQFGGADTLLVYLRHIAW